MTTNMKWKTVDIDFNSAFEVLNLYSSRLFEVDDWEQLSVDQLDFLFVHIVSDYYDHGLGFDVLVGVASMIDGKLMGSVTSEFGGLIHFVGDMGHSIRKVVDDGSSQQFGSVLIDLYRYYEKNKGKIK